MKRSMKHNSGKIRTDVSAGGNHSTLAAIIASAVILGLGAGCTQDDPSSVSVIEPMDACSLLTKADVEAVLETALQEPEKKQYGGEEAWISNCRYVSIPGEEQMLQAGLLLGPHHVAEGPSKAYEKYKTSLRSELGNGFEMEIIEGFGDKAGWFDDGLGGQLTIFQGSFRLIVSSSETDTSTSLKNQKLLAKKVLERLLHQKSD